MGRRLAGTGALALTLSLAGSHARAQAGASPAPAGSVAATVAGTPIALAEVDELVRPQLMDLRAREHQLRSQALDALVARTLIEKEAAARGLTPEALDQAEVAAKAYVTDAELQSVYQANKARLGNKSEQEALDQIRPALVQQRQTERRNAFARELRSKYDVKLLLEPYRVPVELAGAPVRGNPKAPVTILEFSDFQCPFCVRARPTVKRVREVYGDSVRFAFRHFPLDFHPLAQKAGEAAACAGEQDRFWQMHDRLWEQTPKLEVPELKAHAQALGLDTAAFASCLDSGRHAGLVERDMQAGQAYGVSGTPAFFVNGRPLIGAQPFEAFQQVIDDELARATTRAAAK
jgi:predicted DsbA family dithiol-disulfide isomerase